MFHKVLQVFPTDDYRVYIYFADGKIKLFNAKELTKKGLFKSLQNIDVFKNTCTVLNDTLAWDLTSDYDGTKCLDLDPEELYKTCPEVKEEMVFNT